MCAPAIPARIEAFIGEIVQEGDRVVFVVSDAWLIDDAPTEETFDDGVTARMIEAP